EVQPMDRGPRMDLQRVAAAPRALGDLRRLGVKGPNGHGFSGRDALVCEPVARRERHRAAESSHGVLRRSVEDAAVNPPHARSVDELAHHPYRTRVSRLHPCAYADGDVDAEVALEIEEGIERNR